MTAPKNFLLRRPEIDSFLATLARATNGEPLLFLVDLETPITATTLADDLRNFWTGPDYLAMYREELARIDCGDDPDQPWMTTPPKLASIPMTTRTPLEVAGRLLELLLSRWWYRAACSPTEGNAAATSFARTLSSEVGASPKEPEGTLSTSDEEAVRRVLQQGCPEGMSFPEFVQAAKSLSTLLPTWNWLTVDSYLSENLPVHFWWNFPCDEAFVAYQGSSLMFLFVTGTD